MDRLKLPRLNLTGLAIAIALGVVVAVVIYQAQIRGLLPGLNFQTDGPVSSPYQQSQ